MNEIKIYNHPEFGRIRTVERNGEPWFVGKDVAEAVGYRKSRNAVATHVDEDDKKEALIQGGPGGKQNTVIINESGMYSLILSSKLESAKRFKRWVTSEILPSIRKNGGYISGQDTMSDNELLEKALMVAQRRIEERNRRIENMRPKEIFADAVATAKTSILVGDLAKLISQNGREMGQQRMFQWLRDNGYLIKQNGTSWNMPTQRAMEMKLFEVKETAITHSDGHVSISRTVKVTGKGQVYFINKLLKEVDTNDGTGSH